MGIQEETKIGNWKVYKDPLIPNNKILLGYKGHSYLDSGYIMTCHNPLIATRAVFEGNSKPEKLNKYRSIDEEWQI